MVHLVCNFFRKKKLLRKDFLKFESMTKLHKELTNILLLATEDSNFFYCYCEKGRRKCDLCDLYYFLFDENNLMEGLPPKKILQLNFANREKLDDFVDKIFPFFERMEYYDKRSYNFFNKEYKWVCKNWGDGSYWTMTLTEIIDSDKEFVKNNPKLFDKDLSKENPHI